MTYKYEFKYTVDNTIYTLEFPADINIWDLKERIEQFLLGAGWSQGNLDKMWVSKEEDNFTHGD